MAMRLRKSIKVCPGIRMNLSKSGVGFSVGTKGYRTSISAKGRVTRTVGIPGSGLYDIKTVSCPNAVKRGNARNAKAEKTPTKSSYILPIVFAILFIIGAISCIETKENIATIITSFIIAAGLGYLGYKKKKKYDRTRNNSIKN